MVLVLIVMAAVAGYLWHQDLTSEMRKRLDAQRPGEQDADSRFS